jgi:hypothetical protein
VAPVATLFWILGAIFLLNVLAVGWLVTLELVERRRLDKEIKEVDTLWRSLTMPQAQPAGWGAPLGIGGRHRASVADRLPPPPRSVGKVSVGLAVAATALWVVIAALGPGGGRTTNLARGAESPAVQVEGEEKLRGDPTVPASGGTSGKGVEGPGGSSGDPIETSALAVPDSVAAKSHSSTAIYLEWDEVPAAIGYAVERREEATQQGWRTIKEVPESVTAITDGGLEAATTYFYRVSSMTEAGQAPPSDVVSATTPVAVPAATSVTAVAVLDTVTLTWTDVADETGYRIERSLDGATGWAEIGTTGKDVTAYTNVALAPGTTFYYRIVATNAGGESAPSNVTSATTETQQITGPPADEPPSPSPIGTVGEAPAGTESQGGALSADVPPATDEVVAIEASVVAEATP